MESPFKVGDRVRCIDNDWYEDELALGRIYEVQGMEDCGGIWYIVMVREGTNTEDIWLADRFELAKPV